jgi:di/tricarboxylate transporter
MSKVDLAKWIANFAIPLAIALIPCGEVFTMQMKLFFVTTIFAILCFALETMDSTGVAILLPIAWVFFGVATPAVVFGPWNQYIAWVTLSGLFLANVLQRIGLLSRFTFWVVSKTGINYRGILIGMAVASMIITSFIGEHPMLLATIAYGICLAFDFGKSKASAGIMLTTAVSVITAGTFRFAAILTPLGVAKAAGINADLVGFFESWYYNMPMILFWLISVLICIVLFKPEKEIEGKAYFEQKLAEMGPISKDEIRGAMVLFIFIGYIMTQKIHGLSLEWGMALIPWILLFPGVGCATKQDVNKINYGMAFFIIACMGIGSVATSLGLGALVQAVAGPLLSGKSVYVLFAGIWILLFLGNFVMTPLAMIAAFTVPFLNLAAGFGVNPVAVLHFMVSSYDQIVFPYEYAKYLMFFAFGVISMSDFMKFGIVKTIAHIIIAFGILIPWWMFTGFLYV